MGSLPRRELVLVSFLLADSFLWYYTVRALLAQLTADMAPIDGLVINGTFFAAVIASSMLGSLFSGKIGRVKMLGLWVFAGCIASIVPFALTLQFSAHLFVVALAFGSSFGVGMPSCLALFADSTDPGNRGISGGITFFVTNLCAMALAFLGNDIVLILGVSLGLRAVCVGALLPLRRVPISSQKTTADSFKSILSKRTFLLYAAPWLVFSLIDRFERIYFGVFFEADFFGFMEIVGPAVGTVSVLLGGWLADRVGRKRVLTYGFVALGVGYAAIGMAPNFDVSRYFYTLVDGIAWGLFMVIYMLVVWGDLPSSTGAAEKYYTVGSLPFFLADLVALFLKLYSQEISQTSPYTIFSLASFFLFLAVIPLMLASETLPEKRMQERQLKEYLEKAKKVKEKYA